MPSYRSILTVTVLKPGHAPEDVESAARNAVRRMTVLESFQIGIVRGRPRVTVRFASIGDAERKGLQRKKEWQQAGEPPHQHDVTDDAQAFSAVEAARESFF